MSIILSNLSFGWTTPLIKNLSCTFEAGWSAVVGTNGAGKTTLLKIITGEIEPEQGKIKRDGDFLHCRQISGGLPDAAVELFGDYSSQAYKIRNRFGIKDDWNSRWQTLSYGERKRIQIAAAFYNSPDILILDEPTNHLDTESRELLLRELGSFRGTGLVVSHDRRLLDELTYQTLFLEPPGHDLRKLPYTEAKSLRDQEEHYRKEQRGLLKKEVRKLEQQASRYRDLACSADKRRSKKNIKRGDHDASFKMDVARITGKDATHGKLMNQLQGRIKQGHDRLSVIETAPKVTFNFHLHFTPGRRRNLFHIEEGRSAMGDKLLRFGSFELNVEDKAALTGINGCGKSTLLNHIYNRCRTESTLYIPQELHPETVDAFFRRMNELNNAERGEIYSIMAALGSNPERVLLAENPSPGEIRKLLIADAIGKKLELLILDEPTNHLDLHSIEALESALSDYRAGLVMVSHDSYFLQNTTSLEWRIREEGENVFKLET